MFKYVRYHYISVYLPSLFIYNIVIVIVYNFLILNHHVDFTTYYGEKKKTFMEYILERSEIEDM